MLIREFGLGIGGEDMDVRLWQESDRAFSYLSRLGDLAAPMANSFFQKILHEHGARFATLVMALVFIRTMNIADHPVAEGEEMPHEDLLCELMQIGITNRKDFKELVEKVVDNSTDYKGRPVSYDHYDPMEQAAETGERKEQHMVEAIAGKVCSLTSCWKNLFGDALWAAWQNLWKKLVEDKSMTGALAIVKPKRTTAGLNMKLVLQVANKFVEAARKKWYDNLQLPSGNQLCEAINKAESDGKKIVGSPSTYFYKDDELGVGRAQTLATTIQQVMPGK